MEVLRSTKRASTSSLQRRLKIGYNRAASLMDILEEKGIIGPPTETGPRDILIDLDGGIPEHGGGGEPLSEAEASQEFNGNDEEHKPEE
jgi:DNA segregation ATPase FtsK/SpoIIIE-like protein